MTPGPVPEERRADIAPTGDDGPQAAAPGPAQPASDPAEDGPAAPVRLSRRALLVGAVAAAAVAAGATGAVFVRERRRPPTTAEARLESIRKIGHAHLDASPEDRDVDRLRAAMPPAWHRAQETAGGDPWPALQAVAAQARDDLAAQRLVRVDGWVLAITSARAAALVALEG